MPLSAAGQAPATSTTEPAGSREDQSRGKRLHPAEERLRTGQLVARSAQLGRRMRRADARRAVLAYTDACDCRADGWNAWLMRRFDPTVAAAIANDVTERGGPDAA